MVDPVTRHIGNMYPCETLPDGTVQTVDSKRGNKPRQEPTCDENGNPLVRLGQVYMNLYPMTPQPERSEPLTEAELIDCASWCTGVDAILGMF